MMSSMSGLGLFLALAHSNQYMINSSFHFIMTCLQSSQINNSTGGLCKIAPQLKHYILKNVRCNLSALIL